MTIINLSTKVNLLELHRTATQINLYEENPRLPIIRHPERPVADTSLITKLNEDDSLKETRLQLMHNIVADKHDPTLMYNVLKHASPELTKMINAAFTLPTRIPSELIPIANSITYELSGYCDVINILILCAPGFLDLPQTAFYIQTTMLDLQQSQIVAPELHSFLYWDIILRQALKTGVILMLTSSGVAYLIPVSQVLLSITNNSFGNIVGRTVQYSITDGTDVMRSLNNDTHNSSWYFVKAIYNFAIKIISKSFKSGE